MGDNSVITNFKKRSIFAPAILLLLAGYPGGASAGVPRNDFSLDSEGSRLAMIQPPAGREGQASWPEIAAPGDASDPALPSIPGDAEYGPREIGCGVAPCGEPYCVHPALVGPLAR